MRVVIVLIAALSLIQLTSQAAALEVTLAGPLTTIVPLPDTCVGARSLTASIIVPGNAPLDLGIGVVARDRDGRWFQSTHAQRLTPGTHIITLNLDDALPVESHPLATRLRSADLATCDQTGLFFWTAAASTAVISVTNIAVTPEPAVQPKHTQHPSDGQLYDLQVDQSMHTGDRWTASLVPHPFPADPYDPEVFTLSAIITGPHGAQTINGFYIQDHELNDRGDQESATAAGESCFQIRYRPNVPGTYTVTLHATWASGATVTTVLPPIIADGPQVDTLVRVDKTDPRFFSINGEFWWPVGINTHSTYDLRSQSVLNTALTPPRGSLVYEELFPRLQAANINLCEIWMSSWNLALEWRADWPGYHGIGRYNQGNAERLDRVLDLAWQHGLRVNLVINNHGQASPKADREWKDNPYNSENGGPLQRPEEVFADKRSLAGQERLRRYLIARYADHPAIMGWKLWSEVDLTAGKGQPIIDWHNQAAARWKALDPYEHACTTHWCGSYTHVNPGIAVLPDIEYLCIDAYRGAAKDGSNWRSMAQLMADSMADPARGLSRWNKPVLTTEYGASGKAPVAMRHIDLRIACWAALVSGHGGAPMTWWWEWVDQGNRWQTYQAIQKFIAGEDLRGSDAKSVALPARAGEHDRWCRAWVRPGRILLYAVDDDYATLGTIQTTHGCTITIGSSVEPGKMIVQWIDPDSGDTISRHTIDHHGGKLTITAPDFSIHMLAKLYRSDDDESQPDGP